MEHEGVINMFAKLTRKREGGEGWANTDIADKGEGVIADNG